MFVQRKLLSLAAGGLILLWSGMSYAESSGTSAPSATSSTSTSTNTSFKERYLKNFSASHSMELLGPTTKALSGNADGKGNDLTIWHFPSVGYKLSDKYSLSLTGYLIETFNKDRDNDMLNFSDPYATLTNSKIINNEARGFNLTGYVRYYFPVTNATKDAVDQGKMSDNGNGKIRVVLSPTQTFFGGKMEASLSSSIYYRLAKNTNAERAAAYLKAKNSGAKTDGLSADGDRTDFYVYYDPTLAWNVTPKAQVYVEYFSGYIFHNSNGYMPRGRKDPNLGESIALGGNLFPSKRVSLSPSINWGPKFLLSNASFVLFTTIKLL